MLPGHGRPGRARVQRGLDGQLDLALAGLVIDAKLDAVVMGRTHLGHIAGLDGLAADIERHFDLLRLHHRQTRLHSLSLRTPWSVG